MGFGQMKEKLSKNNRAINEKRTGAVLFGCRAKKLSEKWVARPHDSLKKEEKNIVAGKMQLAGERSRYAFLIFGERLMEGK